jgi:TM2 domain-containing membrane protein YozV
MSSNDWQGHEPADHYQDTPYGGAPQDLPPTRPEPGALPPGETYGYTAQPGYAPPPGYGAPPPGYAGGFPNPQAYGVDAYGRPLSDKSKVVAGVLQIALGGFGVGRFYIGDNKTAIWQLVVTLITCGLGHIWGIIDGILILVNGGVDAQGRVLRD